MTVEVMVSSPAVLDLNRLVDFVVPVYAALMVVVLIGFIRTTHRRRVKKVYNFVRKEKEDDSAPKRIYKLEDFMGIWQQESALRMDEWFIWTRKNIAIRLIAPTQFFKLRHKFELAPDGRLLMSRDMGPGTSTISFAPMVIAKNVEEAEWTSSDQANPQERARGRAAFDEATGTFNMHVEDAPQEGKYRGVFLHSRTLDPKDPNKLTTVWTGKFVDPTLTETGGPMTVTSSRVID